MKIVFKFEILKITLKQAIFKQSANKLPEIRTGVLC